MEGRNWRDDFQIALHIQDDVRIVRPTGNIFLTNIHRVYLGDVPDPSLEDDDLRDYFLAPFGPKPVGKTTDSKIDLGEIVREIDELAVFNDEAHHIHDPRMAWFKSHPGHSPPAAAKGPAAGVAGGRDGDAAPRQRRDLRADRQRLSAGRGDRAERGEASGAAGCGQPRQAGRAQERRSSPRNMTTTCSLGVEEWRKSYAEHEKLGKKAVLFVMVDDTRNCDEVGELPGEDLPRAAGRGAGHPHQEQRRDFRGVVRQEQGRAGALRKQSNEIDTWKSPYKAIVSVLMLKEGWDVRNVTVIVGLRAYAAKSNILPEQTLGRGLRRMYFGTRPARDRLGHGHARLHGVRRIHPERRRHLRARADGRRQRARSTGFRSSSRWTRTTPTRTSTRSTLRCPG